MKTIYDLAGPSIQKGISYSFRYRVFNVNGWSDFSDIVIVDAADVPSQPAAITIFEQTSKLITLEFNLGTVDNNGSQITSYKLYSDQGLRNGQFTRVNSYPEAGASIHTLTTAVDGITEGEIYSFRWVAENSVGQSIPSSILRVVAIDKFPPPSTLTKKHNLGSQTSIYVEWSSVSPGPAPGGEVLGYRLKVEDANNGTSWIAFDGQEYS